MHRLILDASLCKVQADSDEESEEEEPKSTKKSKADAKKSKAAAKPTVCALELPCHVATDFSYHPQSIKKPNYGTAPKVEEDHGDVKVGVDESGDKYVELGKKRRATVRQFKGASSLVLRYWSPCILSDTRRSHVPGYP